MPIRTRLHSRVSLVLALAALCAGLFLALAPAARAAGAAIIPQPPPDVILHNGKVVTVDSAFTIAQAIALRNGTVFAVGSDDQILKFKGPGTRVIDLAGRMLMPGLIDSHMHPTAAAMTEFDHEIPSMECIADVLDYFKARAKVVPEGQRITLQQVFITRLREQRWPTRAELDSAAPRHAVIFRTGPDASLNSLALKQAGIDRNFKIPDGVPGLVEKDAAGEPTGILRTWANYVKLPDSPGKEATAAQRQDRLAELLRDYRATGLTTVCDRSTSPDAMELYKSLRDGGRLPVRVNMSRFVNYLDPTDKCIEAIKKIAAEPLTTGGDDWLRTTAVKVFLDGGMLTGSAYMLEPWGVSKIYAITDPAYRGTLFIPLEKLVPLARAAVQARLQFTAHSVGDGSVRTLIDAYEAVSKEMPLADSRPCIEHANFIEAGDVKRLAALGVATGIQPVWLWLDGRTLMAHFGEQRMTRFQPFKSLFAAGAMTGGGSDHMQKIGRDRSINAYNPFLGIYATVARRAKWFDGQVNPADALTREQAIRFYTTNNAWILFKEKTLGSLEKDKIADFIILDRDILTCPEDQIPETQVLETWMDGQQVYKK